MTIEERTRITEATINLRLTSTEAFKVVTALTNYLVTRDPKLEHKITAEHRPILEFRDALQKCFHFNDTTFKVIK